MATDLTIKLLAITLNISVDRLIDQFSDIGIYKTGLDYVTTQEKNILFMHINRNLQKVNISNTLTLQRKTLSTLNVFSSGGRSKKVQVEVRKKRTYVQCDENNKILQHKAEDTISDVSSESNFSNILCDHNNISNDLSFHEKKAEISAQQEKKFELIDKHALSVKISSKDCKYNQYKDRKMIKDDLYSLSAKKVNNNSTISDDSVVFKRGSNSSEINDKKKVSHDRRFRGRQRLRSVKLRNSGKINVNIKYKKGSNNHLNVMKYEYDDLHSVIRGIKNKQRCNKLSTLAHAFNKPTQVVGRDVVIGELITVSELANKMAVKSSQVIKMMMRLGAMVTINQVIDQQTAQLVAEEMGHHVILRRENDLEKKVMNDRDFSKEELQDILEYRAPIVTIMGHVDHGKTSLLDYIRSSTVAGSEEGGITQRIGAYCVEVSNGNDRRMITFLDTPGHKAFTAMRLRGVRVTDIVVLVVAIDDGVMLQTVEAIQHVKVAKIPMIVALNKIDKSGSFDIDRIKNDLAKEGVISEEWGGETQFVSVSAKLGTGIDHLLNAILLESELLELKAVRKAMATGVVIESFLDRGRGPVANVLVREGTLKRGDVVLCGLEYGRVRSMRDEFGNNIILAGPSMPVEIFGLSGPPFAGDIMVVVRDERKAREVALYRQGKFRAVKLAERKQDVLYSNMLNNDVVEEDVKLKFFNIVLKADVQGSVEAISDSLKSLSNSDVKVNIVGSGVGRINETDVSLAIATNSILLGFNVRADILARRTIESETLNVLYHSVIYDLIDDVKKLMDSVLITDGEDKKNVALAEVRDVFSFPKLGNVAGCMILEGIVRRHNKIRIVRKEKVIHEGELASLRRFKDDVNEVRAGMECGIVIKNYTDICSGDVIEIFD